MKTTSRNYTIRLFYFLFACLMYNAWVLYNNEQSCEDTTTTTTIKVIQLKTFLIELIMKMPEVT
ncbi:MAG: hypothetical protein PXY39_07495 [archaeon]|nr:hypothetical protein [archaeon]